MKKHTEKIEIVATKKLNKFCKDDEDTYKVEFICLPSSTIFPLTEKHRRYVTWSPDTFYNPPNKKVCVYDNYYRRYSLSENDSYTKETIHLFVKKAKEIIPTSVKFDENEFTEESAWTTDWSDKLVVKVYRPIGLSIMGSNCITLKDSFLLPKVKDDIMRPCSYEGGFNDRYVTFEKYTNKYFDNVKDIVPVLFDALDILGAEVKVDGEKLSASEAKKIHLWNVKMIEIFMNC